MKDKLKREIRENQVVSQINYHNATLGIVRGGFTAGGQVRYIDIVHGSKNRTKSYNLIILENHQAIRFANEIISEKQEIIENNQDNEYIIENFNIQINNLNTFINTLRKKNDVSSLGIVKK